MVAIRICSFYIVWPKIQSQFSPVVMEAVKLVCFRRKRNRRGIFIIWEMSEGASASQSCGGVKKICTLQRLCKNVNGITKHHLYIMMKVGTFNMSFSFFSITLRIVKWRLKEVLWFFILFPRKRMKGVFNGSCERGMPFPLEGAFLMRGWPMEDLEWSIFVPTVSQL